ncbi:MAG: FAD-binding oxidoreductase [Candidatus Methanolliviera hydrocarbonicum]|uniref:FAD-binding oxidoreductase n=1 Tax=Candidatus Methanolliviera hydrocarbonicum TaxID=2491085 RepID=A0A520KUN7_9EURY|nr:MAG: FAD-binding oxidoreductase [Candidatus Methanolliviera hydrocarbonicum]
MLQRDAYKELEDTIGPENVSEEQALLDGYAWQPSFSSSPKEKLDIWLWRPRPEAVVLPGSTEDVQAILKVCNRYKIKFKAMSTGWGAWNSPGTEGVIQIDLRRMNKILEINEENMYALIEPYVVGAQLQAEAMKKGLTPHIIGAGANTSVLASSTSMQGYGGTGISTSMSGRNVLGVEWVMPNGDILKLGAPGSNAGWFCGDGPGPSLRGIMRGMFGAAGGLGVFTKCAVKLFHWPVPHEVHVEGLLLDTMIKIPENIKFYFCFLPSFERFADAAYKIGEAEIGYMLVKQTIGSTLATMAPHLLRAIAQNQSIKAALNAFEHIFMFMIAANSKRDLEYQEKALKKIISETEGVLITISDMPTTASMALWGSIRSSLTPLAFRYSSSFATTLGSLVAFDNAVLQSKAASEIKKQFVERGELFEDLADNPWGGIYEGSTCFGHQEEIAFFDAHDLKTHKGWYEFEKTCVQAAVDTPMGVGISALGKGDIFGPLAGNYHIWQRKVKKAFDKEDLADSTYYITPEEK